MEWLSSTWECIGPESRQLWKMWSIGVPVGLVPMALLIGWAEDRWPAWFKSVTAKACGAVVIVIGVGALVWQLGWAISCAF